MILADLISKLDTFTPFWLNDEDGNAKYCENKRKADLDNMLLKSKVNYITMDADKVLTIEINI